ncbi:hypothetical protein [Desulfogranum japonicum]|uniref:hypothetical protein n=1 Tax=Desulfogranum japonicum TaxID=231447 RepID=UPI0003FB3B72|nr:hypothetical protein [Desulfogranum japonicum]
MLDFQFLHFPHQYAEKQKRQTSWKDDSYKIGMAGLYNPADEILALVATYQASPFMEVEGYRRLALLKVLAHVEQVSSEHMQAFLNDHVADLGDPYTGEPMLWDANRLILSVEIILYFNEIVLQQNYSAFIVA